MKNMVRFGCGCKGFDLGNGRQIIIRKCYGDDEYPALHIEVGDCIKPENLPGVEISDESQEAIFDEINRLMGLGWRFETIQRLLGVGVKP